MTTNGEGIVRVVYDADGFARLDLIFKGEKRSTFTSVPRAEQAIRDEHVPVHVEFKRKGVAA